MPPSPVVITLRGWKEKQAISSVGLADPLPLSTDADLAARGTSGVLDQNEVMALGQATSALRSQGMPIW